MYEKNVCTFKAFTSLGKKKKKVFKSEVNDYREIKICD